MIRPDTAAVSTLTIDLNAVKANFKLCQSISKARIGASVKANAYGLGADQIIPALIEAGCRDFFTATLEEALAARRHSIDARVYVLGGYYTDNAADYQSNNLIPILNSIEMIARWNDAVQKVGVRLPAVIHFDTGLNRLGLSAEETKIFLAARDHMTSHIDLQMVMSHFAASDEKNHPLNALQATRFAGIARHFPGVPKSLCNSSGLFRFPEAHYDLVRCGYAFYGGNPTPETKNPLTPVVSAAARILQIRDIKAGDSIGYNATHHFAQDTQTATVAVGHGDGFSRNGSDRAKLYWNGQPCAVRGRVSMDLVCVEIGHLPGQKPAVGDWLEILGPHQDIDTLAPDLNTIGYEVLTCLGDRYQRTYIKG